MKKAIVIGGIVFLFLMAVSPCLAAEPTRIHVLMMASATGKGLPEMIADFESKRQWSGRLEQFDLKVEI